MTFWTNDTPLFDNLPALLNELENLVLQASVGPMGPPGFPGQDGDDGMFGVPGNPGSPGTPGVDGAPGVPGFASDGEDGMFGVPGLLGAQGAQGVQGIQGNEGIPGFASDGDDGMFGVPGNQGLQGLPGADGAVGPAGLGFPGMPGDDGDSVFGVPGNPGAQGPPGNDGATGAAGAPGIWGIDGDDGFFGVPGNAGPTGLTGADSTVPGPSGAPGFASDGEDGIFGVPGKDGAAGSGTPWAQVLSEPGTTFTDFTVENGTWSSDGTVIKQTDLGLGSSRHAYQTATKIQTGMAILECEVQIRTSGAIGGILVGGAGGFTGALALRLNHNTQQIQGESDNISPRVNQSFTFLINEWHKLRVVSGGGVGTAYVDDVLRFSFGNNAQASTDATYMGLISSDGEVWYRNMKAWNLGDASLAVGPTGATGATGPKGATGSTALDAAVQNLFMYAFQRINLLEQVTNPRYDSTRDIPVPGELSLLPQEAQVGNPR